MLMGHLAGPVVPAAITSQPIDDVTLVEEIPQSGEKKIFHIPNGFDVA